MSVIQSQIPEEDLGAQGIVSGEATPSARLSTLGKYAYADEDLRQAYEAHQPDFEAHDHASLGGAPLGGIIPGGTARADSFQASAFTTAKLNNLSVSGGAIATGAINDTHIPNQSVTRTKIGAAVFFDDTIGPGGSKTITHGFGRRPLYHISGNGGGNPWLVDTLGVTGCTSTTITIQSSGSGGGGVPFRLVCK